MQCPMRNMRTGHVSQIGWFARAEQCPCAIRVSKFDLDSKLNFFCRKSNYYIKGSNTLTTPTTYNLYKYNTKSFRPSLTSIHSLELCFRFPVEALFKPNPKCVRALVQSSPGLAPDHLDFPIIHLLATYREYRIALCW